MERYPNWTELPPPEWCDVCNERKVTCYVPAELTDAGTHMNGHLIALCDRCAKNENVDPEEYREPREF